MEILNHLETFGFAVLPDVLSEDECAGLIKVLNSMWVEQKKQGNTHITVNMPHLKKPDIFLKYISHPSLLDIARSVLGKDCTACTYAGYQSDPAGGRRVHIDARMPVNGLKQAINMNFMLCLDAFTATNGATRLWPGSHKSGVDPRPFRGDFEVPGGIPAVAPRGAAMINLSQTWHDVGPNVDGKSRWGLGIQYCRWWQKPTYDFRLCGPEIFAMLTLEQKHLFGFTSQPPRCLQERVYTLTKAEDLPTDYLEAMGFGRTPRYRDPS